MLIITPRRGAHEVVDVNVNVVTKMIGTVDDDSPLR